MLKTNRDKAQAAAARGRHRVRRPRRIRPGACASTASRRCRRPTSFLRGDVEVQDEGSQLLAAAARRPSAARWWSTSAPAPAARRWRSARRCATPAACTRSTSTATGSTSSSRAWRAAGCPTCIRPQHRPRARRPHQAPGGQDRPRAGRRAVLRPGHAAPQSRPEVAPVGQGHRRAVRAAGRDPRERLPPAQAGRPPGLRHLQPAAPRGRGHRRGLLGRASGVQAAGRGRAADRPARRRARGRAERRTATCAAGRTRTAMDGFFAAAWQKA